MGAMELQIFVSLLVVLGAAFVALICDFLKGNNEKLREVNIELLVRQEERERAEVGRDRVRRVKPAPEKMLPGLAARAAEVEKVKEPAVAPPMNLPEGIPGYPRRRRAGRGADPEMRPAVASALRSEEPIARPTAIEVMEDWARKVVERGAAGRTVEAAPVEPAPIPFEQPPIPMVTSAIAIWTSPIIVQSVPELITREDRPTEAEPAAPQALHQIAGVDPVQSRVAPVQAEAEAVFAVVDQGWALDVSDDGSRLPSAGELGAELAAGGLAGIEVRTAALPVVLKAIQSEPIVADFESGMPPAAGETAEAPLLVMTELVVLPATTAVSGTWSEVAAETVPILPMAAEASFQANLDVQLLPPDWASAEVEQALVEETAEVAGMPEAEFAVEFLEQFAPEMDPAAAVVAGEPETVYAEAAEPREDEIVRVRVLDEGDLIELSQAVEMSVEPIAAAQAVEPMVGDIAPVRFFSEDREEPVIGFVSVPLEAVDLEPEMLELVAEAECAPLANAPVTLIVEPRMGGVAPVGFIAGELDEPAIGFLAVPLDAVNPEPEMLELVAEVECEPLADAPVASFVEPWDAKVPLVLDDIEVEDLPVREELRLAFSAGEIGQEPEKIAPQAPLVLEKIEPVHSDMERFVDLYNELDLKPKVVQMPTPVQTAHAGFTRPAPIKIPNGIQDRQLLADLIEQSAAFEGVVFFLGLLGYEHLIAEHGQPAVRQAVAAANEYFSSLLGESGFGCWAEESLFVMVLPAESMEAARQLSQQTAEALWDYQLRSLGSLPIIFHWGSAEAAGEPLSMAMESARDQMLESGRARKQVLSTSGRFRRRVVNG